MAVVLFSRACTKNVGCVSFLSKTSSKNYSSDLPEKMNMAAWKRGTGGRSSFNGVVATVFGATGNVGRILCTRLGRIGTQLIIPHRCDFYDVAGLKLVGDLGQVLFQPFDLRDEESILKATKYSNVVVNLIGRDYETKCFKYDDVHVEGARTIARACRKNGVDRLIHLSYLNSAEEPEPIVMRKPSGFKRSKWFGEQAVKEEFPDVTIIKASDIYGCYDRFFNAFAELHRHQANLMPLYKSGNATEKQPVYVGDVAQSIINAARDPDTRGQIYQALGPKRYLLGELVDYLHRLMKKTSDWGYYRYDMKYDPLFALKVTLVDKLSPGYPLCKLHWEGIEKESTTDVVLKGVPTIEDLGVNLTPMEEQAPFEMFGHMAYMYYRDAMDIHEKVEPAPTIPIPPNH